MDLGLSDEQRQLVDSFTNLLAKASTPEHVRAVDTVSRLAGDEFVGPREARVVRRQDVTGAEEAGEGRQPDAT